MSPPAAFAPAALLAGALFGACARSPRSPAPPRPDDAALAELDPGAAEAIRAALATLEAAPEEAPGWGRLGMLYHASDLAPLALAAYAHASELDPSEPRWPYYAAMLRERAGEHEAALAGFEAVRRLQGDAPHPPLLWRLGNARLALGDLAGAEADYRSALAAAPDDHAGWFGLARVRLQREEPEEALAAARRGLALEPLARYGHALLGDALRRLGRWEEARAELELAADAAPFFRDPWEDALTGGLDALFRARWVEASGLFELGRFAEALPRLEELVADHPDDPSVLRLVAEARSRLGHEAQAEDAFARLLAVDPGGRLTLYAWSEHLLRTGSLARAGEALDGLLAAHPDDGRALFLRGALHEARGERAEALASYRRSLFEDQRNPGTRLAIGRLELALRRWEEALATFRDARAAGLEEAEVDLGLARAALMSGDWQAAQEAIARAAARPEADPRALDRLRRDLARERGGS